ncbi:hypothetical protein DL765_007787 [Monosporascus sp. GIB2]|nr:hypothetical protein DL765_007787 [Monosporascus sp. GIB2]
MTQVQEPTPPEKPRQDEDVERGRCLSRSQDHDMDGNESDQGGGDGDVKNENSSNSDGPVRKRRRSRKGLDKKFECPTEGCGKSYSRAEHLYRHQLNHSPKQIYACDFPECNRTFVRLDLCNRHKDRHTAKGSALNRKDSLLSQGSPIDGRRPQFPAHGSASPEANRPASGYNTSRGAHFQYQSPKDANGAPYSPGTNTTPTGYHPAGPPGGMGGYMHHESNYAGLHAQHSHHSPPGPQRPTIQTNGGPYGVLSPVSTQHSGYHSQPINTPQSSTATPYVHQTNFPPFSLPPSDFATTSAAGVSGESGQAYAPTTSGEYSEHPPQHASGEMMLLDQMTAQTTIPVFGSDGVLNKSPYISIPEDFVAYLFNSGPDGSPTMGHMVPQNQYSSYGDYQNQYSMPYYNTEGGSLGYFPPSNQPQQVMSVTNLLDQNLPESILSEEKSQELFDFIKERFHEKDHAPVERLRDSILEGDRSEEHHMLSRKMMQLYIAKLWIFQSLILLELYEKMYSTRELHERAHIHHATTITLMRRGRSLIGKSALDSPPNPRDDRHGTSGSRHSSTSVAHTPDEWWNQWITNETTRRTAFAAFIIDSVHATMFGHSTVMAAHEMRLPLPCDDELWKAPNGNEVGRIETNLMSNGIKPMSFLEGLKRTLGNLEVQTNSFGRQILMAGLLSVSWHMNQRDLQVSSLGGGMSQALGGRDKWRGTLTRAFDSWKTDFDKSLQRAEAVFDPYSYERRNEANVVFESGTILHHLAHMAMHVDIVDCQIFARARRLLGRTIGTQDLNSAQKRMKDAWAPSAKARDATFYALKFLCSVLLAEDHGGSQAGSYHKAAWVPYLARDDVLLNRPWVLYFAALVVWCYGYALEGPCPRVGLPRTQQEKVDQMRDYLQRLGSVPSPEDLKGVKGINKNSALLMVLKDSFESTRWELLHEGATLLNNCIQLNIEVNV